MLTFFSNRALRPASGIERLRTPSAYRATSEDPFFLLDSMPWFSGWYLLELELEYDSAVPQAAKLYIDYGVGFDEDSVVILPISSSIPARRLCYFERRPRAIRFDPLESQGLFLMRRFRLRWVPQLLAKRSVNRWLVHHHSDFVGKSPKEVTIALAKKAAGMGLKPAQLARQYYGRAYRVMRRSFDYAEWMAVHTPSAEVLAGEWESMAENQEAVTPVISLIVPVYNTPPEYLTECIESVLAQVYPHWQLCLVDDASTRPETGNVLREYEQRDRRINVVYRADNGHIVAASNSGLEVAKGEYIGLLDHDDALAPHALLRVIQALNANPSLKLVYSDEDKLSASGQRSSPHFKPDWNPDLLLSQNYICHFTVLMADLVRQVGGFRLGTEGSQDHDLLLRCLPHLASETVEHIPDVLYHWRMIPGSTAANASGKDYTSDAGLNAVNHCLQSLCPEAKAELGQLPNTYRVRWPVPDPEPKVSLLVPTRDGVEILKPCVQAVLDKTEYSNYEILILDNQSSCPQTLNYLESIEKDPRVSVHRWNHPFNFSAINNFGASVARGELIGLLNNDVEPINGEWLTEMVRHASRPDIGCVGAKLYYPDNRIQHAGVILGIGGVAGHSHKYFPRESHGYHTRLRLIQNLSAVTAACLLVRRSVYEQVGGLEEQGLAVAFNDIDFCLKVREAGYRNLWTPYAEAYHHESVSRGAEDTPEKQRRFAKEVAFMKNKWGEALNYDPAYNPHLSRSHEDFSINV
ncbi:glycosyltransferase family 2 protein [Marinimicrobium sp. ARAG 43.8]|uniref:glycosyltransferase family 2 protein n=1 Tax=Marinimicrobium sp. ARAG 43.8 TaxID=3418719 RepID=UPI003CE74F33